MTPSGWPAPTRPTGAPDVGAGRWRRRPGSGRRTIRRDAVVSSCSSRPCAATRGSSRVSSRDALPGSVRRVRAGTLAMSFRARRTSRNDRSGSVAGESPRRTEPARHPVDGDVRPIGHLQGPLDQAMRVVGRVGEAEVVEGRDPHEHVAGALAQARVERRRHAHLDRRRRSRLATPARATASGHRGPWARPPRSAASRRPTPAAAPESVAPAADTHSAQSTARRWRMSSPHSSSNGRTKSARSWRPRRKNATGGPHSRAARSPERSCAANMTASRQLSASRSRRIELRSTAALHGSAKGRSVMVVIHSAMCGQRGQAVAALVELLEGEGAHRLQHPVAHAVRLRLGRHHALVHQGGDVLGGRAASIPSSSAMCVSRVELEAVREHGQPLEHPLLVGVEQAVRPVDRGPHRAVPVDRTTPTSAQQAEAVVEGADDRRNPERGGPGGRQLDGQRDAVEPATDVLDHRAGPSTRGRRPPPRPAVGTARRRSSPGRATAPPRRVRRRCPGPLDSSRSPTGLGTRPSARRSPPRRCRRRAHSCRPPAACPRRTASPPPRPADRSRSPGPS